MDDKVIKKITFNKDLTDRDLRDIRKMLGDKVVQEGTRHVIVAFDNGMDYLAFMVVIEQVTMTNVGDGKRL